MLVKQICLDNDVLCVPVSMSMILRAEIGESEKLLRHKCLQATNDASKKTIIFMDEIDALFSSTSKSDSLIFELCGIFEELPKNHFIIGATNYINNIPEKLIGKAKFETIWTIDGSLSQSLIPSILSKNCKLDANSILKISENFKYLSVADFVNYFNLIKTKYYSNTAIKITFEDFLKTQFENALE